MKQIELNGGATVPALGLGTWKSKAGEANAAVRAAIAGGYRHIDCAAIYGNEDEVGRAIADAIKAGDATREDLWITSKLWNDSHAAADVEPALRKTLGDLGLDYLDLYLIHWPIAQAAGTGEYLDLGDVPLAATWEAMAAASEAGLAQHVGVSNFSASKIRSLISATGKTPVMNQVELHPFLQQNALLDACKELGVALTAYSPLGSPDSASLLRREDEMRLLDHPTVGEVARRSGATVGQVLIAWGLARGTAVIPKSSNPKRIAENFDAASVELSAEDMEALAGLDRAHRFVDGSFWCGPKSPHTLETLWG